jgi:hypothetical protein
MLLSPLPKQGLDANCVECDRPQAKWNLQAMQGLAPICSLCVLYKVPWLNKNADDIVQLIELVEGAASVAFEKDSLGCLLRCEDADRIVSSMVMTAKVTAMMARRPK